MSAGFVKCDCVCSELSNMCLRVCMCGFVMCGFFNVWISLCMVVGIIGLCKFACVYVWGL